MDKIGKYVFVNGVYHRTIKNASIGDVIAAIISAMAAAKEEK